MKKNKKLLITFTFFLLAGAIHLIQKPKEKSERKVITNKNNKQKKQRLFKKDDHRHIGHQHSSKNHRFKIKKELRITDPLTKQYSKQISHYKKRYLKFLSPTIKSEISVKKELKDKLILLVRTINKNSLSQSFEAIVDKNSGKLIVNQGFTINENVKLPRFSPSGEKVNP